MATHDYVIDNQTSANARADINLALQAILTNNSGSAPPSVTAANMLWYDTGNNVLNMRNENDNGWIVVGYLDQSGSKFEVRTDVIQAASASGIDVKNSSGTTIIDLSVASQSTAEAATNNTQLMTPLRVKQSIDANVTAAGWEYVDGAEGTGNTTQTVTGLNVYRTVKIFVRTVETGNNFTNSLSAATTSTYRTLLTYNADDEEINRHEFVGSLTIHNFNNSDAPSGKKIADVDIYRIGSGGDDATPETIFSYNEAWNNVRFVASNSSSFVEYRFHVFGMR